MDAAAGGVLSELIGFFFFGIKEKTKTDAFLGGNITLFLTAFGKSPVKHTTVPGGSPLGDDACHSNHQKEEPKR